MKIVIVGVVLGALAGLALGSIGAAHAQTAEEVAACTPDAKRLCAPTLADAFNHTRIIACLKSHRWRLTPACRSAMTNNGL